MSKEPLSKSDPAAYRNAHYRVERQRGKAAEYTCECGDEACGGQMTWSNISGEYEDPWDYTPMCLSHNMRYDAERRRLESEPQDPCEGCSSIWEAEARVIASGV